VEVIKEKEVIKEIKVPPVIKTEVKYVDKIIEKIVEKEAEVNFEEIARNVIGLALARYEN